MIRYNDQQLASFPWIVSCDTLRSEDLLMRYWQAAEQVLAIKGNQFEAPLFETLERLVGEDSAESNWDDEQATQCVDDLAEILQDHAPSGFHFGASVGDGACFGFWLQEDWVEAFEHMGLGELDHNAELIAELIDGGIEPETIEDSFQGQVEGMTEERAGGAYAEQLAAELGDYAPTRWPYYCIDWDQAWRELRFDGYWLQSTGGGDWLVFRSV